MLNRPKLHKMINTIIGGVAKDNRGQIRFVNDFDMNNVKRFYIIKNSDTDLIRGWRAHRIEQRWFYALSGSFELSLVQIEDFNNPSRELSIEKKKLLSEEFNLLHIPSGYGTAFKALVPNSELLVFADYGIEHAKEDDYTWPLDYFIEFNKQD